MKWSLILFLFYITWSKTHAQSDTSLNSALELLESGEYLQAQQQLHVLSTEESTSDSVFYFLAKSHSLLNENEKAKSILENLIKTSPNFEPAPILLSQIYDGEDDYSNARKVLSQAITRNPENCEIYAARARLYIRHSGYDGVPLQWYESALHFCSDRQAVNVLLELASHYFTLEYYEKAHNTYKELYELAPNDTRVLFDVSNYLSEVGNYEKSNELLTKYLEQVPDDSMATFQMAFNYLALEDFMKSAQYFTNYIKTDSSDLEAWYNRGLAYAANKDYALAISDFQHCLNIDKDHVEARFNMAMVHQNKGAYQTATEQYTLYIQSSPEDPEAYFNRGYCKYYSDDPNGACGDWKQVRRMGREDLWKSVKKLCNN